MPSPSLRSWDVRREKATTLHRGCGSTTELAEELVPPPALLVHGDRRDDVTGELEQERCVRVEGLVSTRRRSAVYGDDQPTPRSTAARGVLRSRLIPFGRPRGPAFAASPRQHVLQVTRPGRCSEIRYGRSMCRQPLPGARPGGTSGSSSVHRDATRPSSRVEECAPPAHRRDSSRPARVREDSSACSSGRSASPAWAGVKKSEVHSQTFPAMSKRP